MEETKNYKAYIPNSLKLRFELFKGFGIKEILVTLLAFIVIVIINYGIYRFYKQISFFIISTIICTIVVATCISKTKNDICIYSELKRLVYYLFKTKNYRIKNERGENYE